MDRYPVVILDRPIRIFDFKPLPLLCLIVASLLALKLSLLINPSYRFGNIPCSIFVFVAFFSLIAGNVKALELKPLKWWMKRIHHFKGPLPVYLPDFTAEEKFDKQTLSLALEEKNTICSCLKIDNDDLEKLDSLQRLKLADLLIDFANDHFAPVQIYSPPQWMQQTENRDFYIITKDSTPADCLVVKPNQSKKQSKSLRLAHRMTKLGLQTAEVGKADLRRLLYGQLSPSSWSVGIVNDAITTGDDLLSLCESGFEHKLNYILIDGKFVSTLHLSNLPLEVNFGLFNKIFDADCDLAFSIYLSSCNSPALKQRARINLRLGTTIKNYGPITPPEHLAKIQAFCQTEMAATKIGVYVTVYADNLPAMENSILAVQRAVHRMGGAVSGCYADELDAMIAALPIGEDLIKSNHAITSQAAAHFIPFL